MVQGYLKKEVWEENGVTKSQIVIHALRTKFAPKDIDDGFAPSDLDVYDPQEMEQQRQAEIEAADMSDEPVERTAPTKRTTRQAPAKRAARTAPAKRTTRRAPAKRTTRRAPAKRAAAVRPH